MADSMTKEAVFELAGLLSQLPQDQVDQLVAELRREQPDLYDYFQSLHRLFPDAREYNQIVGIGYTIWQILQRSAQPPGRVTMEMIYQANEAYAAELKRLTTGPAEARKKAAARVALNHPEPALLVYLAVVIKAGGPSWQDQTYVLASNALRVLLDALIASRGSGASRPAGMVPVGRA